MKKIKLLLVVLLGILILPFGVFAEDGSTEENNSTEESKKVNVYLFRGEGCPHCEEAEEWFESIKEEYGQYFTLKDYETWYDEDNADLMQKVADARKEEASGVPYIIIGNKSWNGFAEDYEEEIKEQIKSEYEKDDADRYDIMELLDEISDEDSNKESYADDVLILILLVVIVGGISAAIVYARKKTA